MPGFSTTEGAHKLARHRNELSTSVTILVIGTVTLILLLLAAIGARPASGIKQPEWRGAPPNSQPEVFDIHGSASAVE